MGTYKGLKVNYGTQTIAKCLGLELLTSKNILDSVDVTQYGDPGDCLRDAGRVAEGSGGILLELGAQLLLL